MAAMGLIQPQDQRAALGAGLSLGREAGGGRGEGYAQPGTPPPDQTVLLLACLTVSNTTAGDDREKALQVAAGAGPGAGSANKGKLRLYAAGITPASWKEPGT